MVATILLVSLFIMVTIKIYVTSRGALFHQCVVDCGGCRDDREDDHTSKSLYSISLGLEGKPWEEYLTLQSKPSFRAREKGTGVCVGGRARGGMI